MGWGRPVERLSSGAMTRRAQAYLTILGARHFFIGVLALSHREVFNNPSFSVIRGWAPMQVWGLVFLLVGILGPLVAWKGREYPARFFILVSLMVTSFWGASFVAEWVLNGFAAGVAAPMWAILWMTLALKDMVISAMPLRSPFEDYLAEKERQCQANTPPLSLG